MAQSYVGKRPISKGIDELYGGLCCLPHALPYGSQRRAPAQLNCTLAAIAPRGSPGRHRAILTPRPAPTIAGSEPVGNGSAFTVPGGSGARAVASGNRVRISRRKPSSVSTLAAILAISANPALLALAGLLAASKAERSGSALINGAYFSRKRCRPMASSASA